MEVRAEVGGFDSDDFSRAVQEAMEDFTARAQHLFDELGVTHRGRPVGEIEPVLRTRWREMADGDLEDAEVAEWSQAISDGNEIVLHYEGDSPAGAV